MMIRLVRLLWVMCLAVWAAGPRASAQSQPSLGLTYSAGHATLSITGTVGTVYSIQYANDLSPTNHWTDRTLVQARAGGTVWTDPSAPTPSQRFYRAVSVPAPADTNLVFIQPGTFTMGSATSEPSRGTNEIQHVVTISRGFWIGKYLVTQGDFLAVVGRNPSWFNGVRAGTNYGTDLTRPVEMVSWNQATNYCARRTQQERAAGLIPTNYVYRLPTESEWEYACRAGTTTALYLGSGLYSGQANFDGRWEYDAAVGNLPYNPSGIWLQQTTPVGSYGANGWGLYDMIGNVFELCQDWYDAYPPGPVTDPPGPDSSPTSFRVMRGGSWNNHGYDCRSARRRSMSPDSWANTASFRVVLGPG